MDNSHLAGDFKRNDIILIDMQPVLHDAVRIII